MRAAMALGALACFAIGVSPAATLDLVIAPAARLAGADASTTAAALGLSSLSSISRLAALLGGTVLLLAAGRHLLLRRREVAAAVT